MKKLFILLTFVLGVFVLTACKTTTTKTTTGNTTGNTTGTTTVTTTAPVVSDGYLVFSTLSDPQTWDPSHNSAADGGHIINNMFEGLYRATATGIELAGATSVDVSTDLKTYTFHLRENAKWSNGEAVTAGDYKYSWLRVIDPVKPSEYSFIMSPYIVGAEAYLKGTGTAEQVGIEVVNDFTLKVTLINPVPYFTQLLSFYTYLPVYSADGSALAAGWEKSGTVVSNGPFKFKEYAIGSHITIEKNDQYWNKADVKIKGVRFQIIGEETTALNAYNQGDVHVLDYVPLNQITELNATNPDFEIQAQIGTYFYVFNMDDETIGTPAGANGKKIRQALSMAIDRTSIVENVTRGGQIPATQFVPDTLSFSDGTPWTVDYGIKATVQKDAAKQLLAEAGYSTAEQLNNLSRKIKLGYNSSDGNNKIAVALQAMWKENLGLNVSITQEDWAVFQDSRKYGDYSIARHGWLGDYPDPNTMLDLFTSYSGNNDSQWRWENGTGFEHDTVLNPGNKAFDDAIEAAMTASGAARDNFLKEAERILVQEEVAVLPIYHYNRLQLINSSTVDGVVRTQMGHWWFGDAELFE
ncbi:MAG: extracellular solute-binding protein family 5 [Haloplasmataceae bacterium]|nr:extracellular solute-binding protein family 5 [Haloplasmataceae bacterium]